MGQFSSLTCSLSDGDLPLSILWTFNNHPITSEMDVLISKLGKRSSVLTIESVDARHAGNYSCQGENLAGSTTHSTELKVIGSFIIHFRLRHVIAIFISKFFFFVSFGLVLSFI